MRQKKNEQPLCKNKKLYTSAALRSSSWYDSCIQKPRSVWHCGRTFVGNCISRSSNSTIVTPVEFRVTVKSFSHARINRSRYHVTQHHVWDGFYHVFLRAYNLFISRSIVFVSPQELVNDLYRYQNRLLKYLRNAEKHFCSKFLRVTLEAKRYVVFHTFVFSEMQAWLLIGAQFSSLWCCRQRRFILSAWKCVDQFRLICSKCLAQYFVLGSSSRPWVMSQFVFVVLYSVFDDLTCKWLMYTCFRISKIPTSRSQKRC